MSATINVSDLVTALTKLAGEHDAEPVKSDPWAGLIGPEAKAEEPAETGEPECTCTCHKADEDAGGA